MYSWAKIISNIASPVQHIYNIITVCFAFIEILCMHALHSPFMENACGYPMSMPALSWLSWLYRYALFLAILKIELLRTFTVAARQPLDHSDSRPVVKLLPYIPCISTKYQPKINKI